jgi:hypothetical protein
MRLESLIKRWTVEAVLAERLQRRSVKLTGSPCMDSNPTGVVFEKRWNFSAREIDRKQVCAPQSDPINRLLFSIPLVLRVTLTFQQPRKNDAICTMNFNWPRGVTVSTLDPESSDRGSNPREAFPICVMLGEASRALRATLALALKRRRPNTPFGRLQVRCLTR